MAVTVDRSVLAAARRGAALVLTVAPARGTTIDPGVLADAATTADAALAADSPYVGYPPVRSGGAWPGDRGPVTEVVAYETPQDLEAWLAVLTKALEDVGCVGRLGLERMQGAEVYEAPVVALTAVLCPTGWAADDAGRVVPSWRRTEGDPTALPAAVVGWLAEAGWPCYVRTLDHVYPRPVERLLPSVMEEPGRVVLTASPDPEHVRQAAFDRSGRVVVHHHDAGRGWRGELEELRRLLVAWAPYCEHAFVRRSRTNALSTSSMLEHLPPVFPGASDSRAGSYYDEGRGLDDVLVPDAHGMQLLTEAHLARLAGADHWLRTPVADGLTLVEAPEPEAWFADEQPDPAVLERARSDFRDLIMWQGPPRRGGS